MRFLFTIGLMMLTWVAHAQDFPSHFTGHWKGQLEWYQGSRPEPKKVTMQLIVRKADTAGQYHWQLIYGDTIPDNRPYLLVPVDTAKGHWRVDERNGIFLDQFRVADKFICAFTVQSTSIVTSYYTEKENLIVEFYSFSSKPVQTSGGQSKDIPFVDSYGVKGYQRAVLKKVGE